MIGAIRAEALRARSGWTTLGMIGMTLLVPIAVLIADGDPAAVVEGLGPDEATRRLVTPLAWSFVAAGFIGSYTVTREYYYHSLDRTVLLLGVARAQLAKAAGGALVALATTAALCVVWCAAAALLLAVQGSSFRMSGAVLGVVGGAFAGAVLGAAGGCAVGWVVRNYYAAAVIVLAGPLALELTILGRAPDLARFLPGLTIASIGAPGYRDALFDPPVGALLAVAWVVAACVAAVVVGRRLRR